MKKVNRFILVFVAFSLILAYCVLFSHNPYINVILIYGGFIMCILTGSYVFETITEKEQKIIDKINNIFFED